MVMIIYSDYDCPFCARFAADTMPALEKDYVETGKLGLAFRHLPLESIHPTAIRVAEAAECAGEQGRFWPMHDLLFQKPKPRDDATLRTHAAALALDLGRYDESMTVGRHRQKVGSDSRAAAPLGIASTPTFLIGAMQRDGQVRVTERLVGAQPLDAFVKMMTPLLTAAPAQ